VILGFFEKITRGSYVFGKKLIVHMIAIAMRVLKIYRLSVLEIFKVRTTLGTLCTTTPLKIVMEGSKSKITV